jgi:RNA polymerase sigma factor (sigma-70 family)
VGSDDDIALFDAWGAGDRRAGNALCERYFDPLCRFFGNKAAAGAEDLVQETLTACFQAHGRFERRSSFRTFVYAIARNILSTYIHKHGRMRTDPDFSVHSIAELCPTPSSMAARNEAVERLDEALRRLPVDYQITLELYYWEGMPARELAGVLGLTEPGTRSRLRRAKEALHDALGDQNPWPPPPVRADR